MGVLLMKIKMEPPETDSYDNIVISMGNTISYKCQKVKTGLHSIVSRDYRKICLVAV